MYKRKGINVNAGFGCFNANKPLIFSQSRKGACAIVDEIEGDTWQVKDLIFYAILKSYFKFA